MVVIFSFFQITTPRKNENKYGDHTSKSKGLIQKVPVKMAQRGNKEVLTLRKDNDMLSIENGQDTHRNTTVTKQTFKEKHIKKELQKRQDPKGTKPLQPKLTES